MCEDCGCGDSELVPVEVQRHLLESNNSGARHNREHFEAAGVLAINLMGSPGSGKTALLEATAHRSRLALRAMSGDLATDNDAQRLEQAGIPAAAITTGNACHLDAKLVHHALHHMKGWQDADVVFIENVGNLVCPAIYDLGQAANVVCLSVTEGEDKPLKYPVMFHHADLVVITKIDLLPYLGGISLATIERNLAQVMPEPRAIAVSAISGQGIEDWLAFLAEKRPGRSEDIAKPVRQHHHPGHHHAHPKPLLSPPGKKLSEVRP